MRISQTSIPTFATGLHNHYELINRIDNTEPLTGDLPSVITETGYNNGTMTKQPARGQRVRAGKADAEHGCQQLTHKALKKRSCTSCSTMTGAA